MVDVDVGDVVDDDVVMWFVWSSDVLRQRVGFL
jgi:hypothetical protein